MLIKSLKMKKVTINYVESSIEEAQRSLENSLNAVNQAKEFKDVAEITGIILTKLDGTAKGGVVLSIKNDLKVPVKFIGVGEGIDDLRPFEPAAFAEGLFEEEKGEE